jgi:hypothetical protein
MPNGDIELEVVAVADARQSIRPVAAESNDIFQEQ